MTVWTLVIAILGSHGSSSMASIEGYLSESDCKSASASIVQQHNAKGTSKDMFAYCVSKQM